MNRIGLGSTMSSDLPATANCLLPHDHLVDRSNERSIKPGLTTLHFPSVTPTPRRHPYRQPTTNDGQSTMTSFIRRFRVFCVMVMLTAITTYLYFTIYLHQILLDTSSFGPLHEVFLHKELNHHYCDKKIVYGCQGEAYNNFTSSLVNYVREKNHTSWGKRSPAS